MQHRTGTTSCPISRCPRVGRGSWGEGLEPRPASPASGGPGWGGRHLMPCPHPASPMSIA
eukprot:365166-Chlamydomonas_euryale.AAC.8